MASNSGKEIVFVNRAPRSMLDDPMMIPPLLSNRDQISVNRARLENSMNRDRSSIERVKRRKSTSDFSDLALMQLIKPRTNVLSHPVVHVTTPNVIVDTFIPLTTSTQTPSTTSRPYTVNAPR